MVAERISRWNGVPVGIAALQPEALVPLSGERSTSIGALFGKRVLVVSGIAEPEALAAQLRDAGLLVDPLTYRDHHAFSSRDIEEITSTASRYEAVLCTLKDAVKLSLVWPRSAPPLWYVSQRVVPEVGAEFLDAAIERVLNGRP